MRITLFILLIFAHYVKNMADLGIPVEKYVDQKDMSERCKRRVAPSIFLGKEVMDASSYVMRLSRLEVPYSCSVSVRAEIGYNIIMIIHLLSSESLEEACSENPNQLIVYELGETFGGYWGHMPDVMMKNTMKNYTKFYTLKTTQMSSTRTTERIDTYDEEEEDEEEDHVIDSEKLLVQSIPATTDKESDYIRVEIPLVNVSGNLQLSDPPRHTYNSEELFDFIYDVTPNNGSEYETSIMPLVQFSIKEMKGLNKDMKPRYELSYDVNGFTLDSRLTYSTKRRINIKKSNWMANRRYNLRKKMKIPYTRKNVAPTVSDDKLFAPCPHFTSNSTRTTNTPTLDEFYLTMPWRQFEYTFDQFNVTSPSTVIEDITLKDILNNITEMQNYLSAYPRTNLSIFHDITSTHHGDLKDSFRGNLESLYATEEIQASSAKKITKFEIRFSSDHYVRENTEVLNNIRKKIVTVKSSTLSQSYNENISNTHIYAKESTNKNKNTPNDDIINVTKLSTNTRNDHNLLPNGTLVNHESWENVVQSAHVMAKILNRTEINSNKLHNETLNFNNKTGTSELNKMRKKRYVKSLDIEKSRPRNLTTQQYTTSETEKVNLFDIQYLSRLVELQDDEIGGRVALRYLRNYVGGALFNICDYQEAQSQQMFLFNASRLVIAVSNMTLERMMIVLTPAFPLFGNVSRCPPEHLECQIIGSRVCIDSLNACDGIPNCGSYDIYDEDRRLCGVSKGLPHNIYIAAFSFLALLLILLYTIYYWLKRCVPRVSEAFFIFSDTSEIKLQLDTIMRSPTDVDDFSDKFVYPGNFFDDVSLQDYEEQSKKSNIFTRFCIAYCGFLLCIKKNKKNEAEEKSNKNNEFKRPSRMYSFTELELLKYRTQKLKDEGVQTGDSIDIRVDKNINNLGQNNARDSLTKFKLAKQNVVDQNYSDELNLIKFSKNSKLSENDIKTKMESFKTKGLNMLPSEDEKEIKSTIYDRPSDLPKKIPVTCEVHHEDVKKATTSKHLRFDESPTFIESLNVDEDITESSTAKDSFTQGNEHSNKHKLETISEEDSKDNTRFWKFKNKKQKKKIFF